MNHLKTQTNRTGTTGTNKRSIKLRVEIRQPNVFDNSIEGPTGIGLAPVITYLRKLEDTVLEETFGERHAKEDDIKRRMYGVLNVIDGVVNQKGITFENQYKKYEAAIFVARFMPAYINFNRCTNVEATEKLLDVKRIFDTYAFRQDEFGELYRTNVHLLRLYEDMYSEEPLLKIRQEVQKKDVAAIKESMEKEKTLYTGGDMDKGHDPNEYFKLIRAKVIPRK